MNPSPYVLCLTDDFAGHRRHLFRVADALPFAHHAVRIAHYITLPTILSIYLPTLCLSTRRLLVSHRPCLVLSAGRRTIDGAVFLKRYFQRIGHRAAFVHLTKLDYAHSYFDCWVDPAGRSYSSPSVLSTLGTATAPVISPLPLSAPFADKLYALPSPRLAVFVGGDTKEFLFTASVAFGFVRRVRAMATTLDASVMVSFSRRTPASFVSIIKDQLQDLPALFSHDSSFYTSILSIADGIVVTGDSLSMISESCGVSSLVPVYIYVPDGFSVRKYVQFHRQIYAGGYALPLSAFSVDTFLHTERKVLAVVDTLRDSILDILTTRGYVHL